MTGDETMATTTRRKVKTVERGMLEGKGETITAARRDLDAQIEAALTGSYDPAIVGYGAYEAVCYRRPDGWWYKMVERADPYWCGVRDISGGGCYPMREQCVQAAAFHVLDIGAGSDEFHRDADIPDFLTVPRLREQILSNQRWRRAWRYARDNGLGATDHEWHGWACHNSRDPRFS
jgi:hypothetical protein